MALFGHLVFFCLKDVKQLFGEERTMKMKRIAFLFSFSFLLFLGSFCNVFANDLQTGIDAYTKQDFKTAFKIFLGLAKQGNLDAQNNLGVMYFQKQGLPEGITEFERLRGARWWWNAGAENAEKSGNRQTNIKLKMNISQINHQHGLLKAEIEKFLKTKKCEKCWIGDSGVNAMQNYDLSDLSGVNLSGSNLKSWGLVNSNLSGADLSEADLRNADLRNADLTGADLTGATLTGVSLEGAKWRTAKISGTILEKVLAEEKIAQERLAADKAKQKKLAADKAKQKKLAADKAYREKKAAEEKAYRERRAAERAEKKRLAEERAEAFEPGLLAMEKSRFMACKAFMGNLRAEILSFDGTYNESILIKELKIYASVGKSRQITEQEIALSGGKLQKELKEKYGSDTFKKLKYLHQKTVECGGESKQIALSPRKVSTALKTALSKCALSAPDNYRGMMNSFFDNFSQFHDRGFYSDSITMGKGALAQARQLGLSNCHE